MKVNIQFFAVFAALLVFQPAVSSAPSGGPSNRSKVSKTPNPERDSRRIRVREKNLSNVNNSTLSRVSPAPMESGLSGDRPPQQKHTISLVNTIEKKLSIVEIFRECQLKYSMFFYRIRAEDRRVESLASNLGIDNESALNLIRFRMHTLFLTVAHRLSETVTLPDASPKKLEEVEKMVKVFNNLSTFREPSYFDSHWPRESLVSFHRCLPVFFYTTAIMLRSFHHVPILLDYADVFAHVFKSLHQAFRQTRTYDGLRPTIMEKVVPLLNTFHRKEIPDELGRYFNRVITESEGKLWEELEVLNCAGALCSMKH